MQAPWWNWLIQQMMLPISSHFRITNMMLLTSTYRITSHSPIPISNPSKCWSPSIQISHSPSASLWPSTHPPTPPTLLTPPPILLVMPLLRGINLPSPKWDSSPTLDSKSLPIFKLLQAPIWLLLMWYRRWHSSSPHCQTELFSGFCTLAHLFPG